MNRSASTCGLLLLAVAMPISLAVATTSDDPPANSGRLSAAAAQQLKSTVAYSKDSIDRGRAIYLRSCTECHGADGKSQLDVISNATDLTDPKQWVSGTSEGEIFRSIRDGAGEAMPPFKEQFEKEDDLWHLVNFLRSLWPASSRPTLVER